MGVTHQPNITTPVNPTGVFSSNIACLGFINPGLALAVAQYPPANGGTFVQSKQSYLGSDAVIVAMALAKWGMGAHLLTNALGDDALGRNAKQQCSIYASMLAKCTQPNRQTLAGQVCRCGIGD